MNKIKFIGRGKEIDDVKIFIEQVINGEKDSQIICVGGSGGIGKTRFLQKIREDCIAEYPNLLVAYTDFDDPFLQVKQKLWRRIANQIDQVAFSGYFDVLLEWRKLRKKGASFRILETKHKQVQQVFIDTFNNLSQSKKIILFIDTTDHLTQIPGIWDDFIEVIPYLKDCAIIMAGRNGDEIAGKINTAKDVKKINLLFFESEHSEIYIHKKEKDLHFTIGKELVPTLISLTEGRPILLDLAGEWLAGDNADLLVGYLKSVSDSNQKKIDELKKEFEKKLVMQYSEIRTDLDRLILILSHIYPLDEKGVIYIFKELFDMHVEDIDELLKQTSFKLTEQSFISLEKEDIPAQILNQLKILINQEYMNKGKFIESLKKAIGEEKTTKYQSLILKYARNEREYAFIKILPNKRVSLHDVMRELVNKYIWIERDPDEDRKVYYSQTAIDYFENEIEFLENQIKDLESQKNQEAKSEIKRLLMIDIYENEIWVFKNRLLKHALIADIQNGMEKFVEFFKKATEEYHFNFRQILLDTIVPYAEQLPTETFYNYANCLAVHLRDTGKYKKAKRILINAFKRCNLTPMQRINLLNLSGDTEIRLGHFRRSTSDFEMAFRICEENHLSPSIVIEGMITLAWGYINEGEYSLAHQYHEKAYKKFSDKKSTDARVNISLEVATLRNLAFTHAYLGNEQKALYYAEKAFTAIQTLKKPRDIAYTYSVIGTVHAMFGYLGTAEEYISKAYAIFDDENDKEYMVKTKFSYAFILRHKGKLDEAEENLLFALKEGTEDMKPSIYNALGKTYLQKYKETGSSKDLEKAKNNLKTCRVLSNKMGNNFYEYRSFSKLIELAWEFEKYEWSNFMKEYQKFYAERKSEMDLRLRGTTLKRLGDLAICKENDYQNALDLYKQGFKLIAGHEVHKRHNIETQLKQTNKRLKIVSEKGFVEKDVISQLGKDLLEFWKEYPKLVSKYPQVQKIFQTWQEGGFYDE